MIYKYKCGDEIISVFVWNDEFHNTVSVKDSNTNESYERTIREDENGRFFTWNHNKIYLDNWLRITMRELKKKIEDNEWVGSNELCQAILTDGVENVRFIVPFCIRNKYKDTLCRVEERWNREVKQNYKIILVPINSDEEIASYKDYYTSDFISLINNEHIRIVV